MDIRARELLDDFNRLDWFCNIRKPLLLDSNIVQVVDWDEAMSLCAAQSSYDARLEGQNELTVQIFLHRDKVTKHWNSLVGEFRSAISRLVSAKMRADAFKARVPAGATEELSEKLKKDLVLLCMAREHEFIVKTKYFGLLEHWYLAGRFPCGWVGDVPDDMEDAFALGKLAVL
jgi:hypothetical protein